MTEESPQESPKIGRPSDYTQELADRICDLLSDGISLRRVCSMESMPAKITVLKWIRTKEDFAAQYARAKAEAADTYADDMTDIADDGSNDWTEALNKDGEPTGRMVPNLDHIARSRLRVDTRKWIAAKLKPKKYGEKIELEHSASDNLLDAMKAARERAGLAPPDKSKA
jgi:hypothetical protein